MIGVKNWSKDCIPLKSGGPGAKMAIWHLFIEIQLMNHLWFSISTTRKAMWEWNLLHGSCSSTICLKAQIFIWTGQFDFSPWLHLIAPFNNTRTLKFKAQPDKRVFRRRQSSVWRLLPASCYCRTLVRSLNCAQRLDYHVLNSGCKLAGAVEHLIYCSEKRICRLSFEF